MSEKSGNFVNEPLGPEDALVRNGPDIEQSFVDVGLIAAISATSSNSSDFRVIVGRKGSGKTHVLRHIENLSRADGRAVSLETLDENLLGDRQLVQFQGTMGQGDSITFWTNCWRLAVISAALSNFTCRRIAPRAANALRDLDMTQDDLREGYKQAYFQSNEPFGPVAALKKVLVRYKSLPSAQAAFRELDFTATENEIGNLLHAQGDIHYLIDGLDEFAWIDPRLWLEPQLGLFKLAFMQRVTRSNIRRVFLTITLRNYVYSHALRDTHRDRAQVGAGVVPLIWDRRAAGEFLDRRLRQISDLPFARSTFLDHDKPLANWLGFDDIVPRGRERSETVEHYLLRHTRCSPRHVIRMFTKLCHKQNDLSRRDQTIDAFDFQDVVTEQSREIALTTLGTASEELLSFMPAPEARFVQPSRLAAAKAYQVEQMAEAIRSAISVCGKEVILRTEFRDSLAAFLPDVAPGCDSDELITVAEEVLWRSGIIAYQTQERGANVWRYTWSEQEVGLGRIPADVSEIGFHPSLVGYCNLEVSRHGPVF